MLKYHFLSSNEYKFKEFCSILSPTNIKIVRVNKRIAELQTTNIEELLKDKIVKAFGHVRRPLIVEHAGLELDCLNGFPGGLTQIFWDSLQADRFCQLFGSHKDTGITAVSVIAVCDGKKIHTFRGECRGTIAPAPRGPKHFQWDCVFMPAGHDKTFAELGERKNDISMRKKSLDAFALWLKSAKTKA